MRILILLTTFVFLAVTLSSYADVFQYEDENGTVIMTDRSENVPAKHLKKSRIIADTKTNSAVNSSERIALKNGNSPRTPEKCDPNEGKFRLCQEYLRKSASELPNSSDKYKYVLAISEVCSEPTFNDRFTEQEKRIFRNNDKEISEAKKQVPSNIQNEIKMFSKIIASACKNSEIREETKSYSRQELDEIGKKFTQMFKELSATLTARDFKKAAEFYHEQVKDDWQRNYSSLSKNDLRKVAQDMQHDQVYVDRIEDNTRAVCQLLTNVDGERYSFHLVFQRDNNNNWKILSM